MVVVTNMKKEEITGVVELTPGKVYAVRLKYYLDSKQYKQHHQRIIRYLVCKEAQTGVRFVIFTLDFELVEKVKKVKGGWWKKFLNAFSGSDF